MANDDEPEQVSAILDAWLRTAQRLEDEVKAESPPSEVQAETAEELEVSSSEAIAAVALRQKKMKIAHQAQLLELRKKLANWALYIVIGQLGIANIFFLIYLLNNAVDPDPAIMVAWLSSTVVEVIGILWVIARSLFPFRDRPRSGLEKMPQSVQGLQ